MNAVDPKPGAGVQNQKIQSYREFVEHPQTAAIEAVA